MASNKPRGKRPQKGTPQNDSLHVHRVASHRHLNIGVEIAKAFTSQVDDSPNPIVTNKQ